MKWNSLEYVIRSQHGQDGVYFIYDGQEERVLKAPCCPAAELFLTLLAKKFGLSTPDIEVIHPDSTEYSDMIEAIKPHIDEQNARLTEAQKEENNKNEDERDVEIIEKNSLDLESPHIFFLMDKIDGECLIDASEQDLLDWYGSDSQINQEGEKFFKDLGKLLVFDALTRNVDRFIFWKMPGIGELESALGNIGNIFIRDNNKQLTVIDSLTSRDIEIAEYALAVKEMLASTLNSSPDNLVDRGKETIELTGYEVKENGRALILQGVQEGIRCIQSLNQGEILAQIKEESRQQLSNFDRAGASHGAAIEQEIDGLFQFIKRIASQATTAIILTPLTLHLGGLSQNNSTILSDRSENSNNKQIISFLAKTSTPLAAQPQNQLYQHQQWNECEIYTTLLKAIGDDRKWRQAHGLQIHPSNCETTRSDYHINYHGPTSVLTLNNNVRGEIFRAQVIDQRMYVQSNKLSPRDFEFLQQLNDPNRPVVGDISFDDAKLLYKKYCQLVVDNRQYKWAKADTQVISSVMKEGLTAEQAIRVVGRSPQVQAIYKEYGQKEACRYINERLRTAFKQPLLPVDNALTAKRLYNTYSSDNFGLTPTRLDNYVARCALNDGRSFSDVTQIISTSPHVQKIKQQQGLLIAEKYVAQTVGTAQQQVEYSRQSYNQKQQLPKQLKKDSGGLEME